jgi:hypothetical protein
MQTGANPWLTLKSALPIYTFLQRKKVRRGKIGSGRTKVRDWFVIGWTKHQREHWWEPIGAK